MALTFLIYTAAFWFIHKRQRTPAFISIVIATAVSVGFYLYHADSSLGLNF